MSKRELFCDVLNEGGAAEFEEAVFRKTVGTARRARRMRAASRGAVVVLAATIAVLQFWPRAMIEKVKIVSAPEPKAGALSHTILRTQRFTGAIRSEGIGTERVLASTSASAVSLRTGEADAGDVRRINDEELMAFFAGKAIALVHRGPNDAELIFLEGTRGE